MGPEWATRRGLLGEPDVHSLEFGAYVNLQARVSSCRGVLKAGAPRCCPRQRGRERAAEEGVDHTYTICWAGVVIFPGSQVDPPEGHLDSSHLGSIPPKNVSGVDKETST